MLPQWNASSIAWFHIFVTFSGYNFTADFYVQFYSPSIIFSFVPLIWVTSRFQPLRANQRLLFISFGFIYCTKTLLYPAWAKIAIQRRYTWSGCSLRWKDNIPQVWLKQSTWVHKQHSPHYSQVSAVFFTITPEIHVRSLIKFYCQHADRRMNLKFMRCVSERERAIRQFVFAKNKLMSVFNASVLVLTMNFVITLSK